MTTELLTCNLRQITLILAISCSQFTWLPVESYRPVAAWDALNHLSLVSQKLFLTHTLLLTQCSMLALKRETYRVIRV